jgi:membrane protease YdiL (CAAX protease family)
MFQMPSMPRLRALRQVFWMMAMSEENKKDKATPPFLMMMKGSGVSARKVGFGIILFLVVSFLAQRLSTKLKIIVMQGTTDFAQYFRQQNEIVHSVTLLFIGFGIPFLGLLAWRKWVERRSIKTMFTASPNFRWKLAFASFLFVGILSMVVSLGFSPDATLQLNRRLAETSLLGWLILSLVYAGGIGVQATLEEVFVRGWLLQHISRLIINPIVAIVLGALVFGAIHLGSPGWATYVLAFGFGLAFGWSVWRLNGLEAAIGAHIANNFFASLFFGAMVHGNMASMTATDFALYGAYLGGFLLFVEFWARFFGKPSLP